MTKRLVLFTLVLLGVGNVFSLKQGQADPGGVPAQIARLQATVDAIKNSVAHIDPTIIGETTFTTGLLLPSGDNDRIVCTVVNVSEATVSVSISIVTNFGIVEDNSIVTVPPHEGVALSTSKFILAGYCRFNFSGAPNSLRANAWFQDLTGGSFKFVTDAR